MNAFPCGPTSIEYGTSSLCATCHCRPLPTSPCVDFRYEDVLDTRPSQGRGAEINVSGEGTVSIGISCGIDCDRGSVAASTVVTICSFDPKPITPCISLRDEEIIV